MLEPLLICYVKMYKYTNVSNVNQRAPGYQLYQEHSWLYFYFY